MYSHAPTAYNAYSANEQKTLKSDMSQISKHDASDYFRGLALRHYVDTVIAKNEQSNVTTDVSIVDMQSQKAIEAHNLDTEQFAASINKLPVALLLLHDLRSGGVILNQQITWTADDVRGGNGVFDQPGAPTQGSLKDLMYDMLNRSGNTAVRVLVNNVLGGAAHTNDRFKNELKLDHTYLQPLDDTHFYLGNSTARDSLNVMKKIGDKQDAYGSFVRNALATNIYTQFGVRSQLDTDNEDIVLVNKVGILDDPTGNNRHDVGIIYNTKTHKSYGYSIMTTAPGASTDQPTAQAGVSLANIGEGMLQFASDVDHHKGHNKSSQNDQQVHTDLQKDQNSGITPEAKVRY